MQHWIIDTSNSQQLGAYCSVVRLYHFKPLKICIRLNSLFKCLLFHWHLNNRPYQGAKDLSIRHVFYSDTISMFAWVAVAGAACAFTNTNLIISEQLFLTDLKVCSLVPPCKVFKIRKNIQWDSTIVGRPNCWKHRMNAFTIASTLQKFGAKFTLKSW
jgi:hypothetical protein